MDEAKGTLVGATDLRVSEEARRTGPGREDRQSLHPLVELTSMRVREFLREREAVFWVFIFPVLMTFALGIAFRNTAPDKTLVAIEAEATDPRVNEVANILAHSPEVTSSVLSPEESAKALRSGKVAIVVTPNS